MKKRLFAWLMVAVMLISVLPLTALAGSLDSKALPDENNLQEIDEFDGSTGERAAEGGYTGLGKADPAEEEAAAGSFVANDYDVSEFCTPGKTAVIATKVWDDSLNQDGIRPEEVTVRLLANGQPTDRTVTLNAYNRWTAVFADLDIFADGAVVVYTVEEAAVDGYEPAYVWNEEGTVVTIFNTHEAAKTSVAVTKVWDDGENQDGLRPDFMQVQLKADGAAIGVPVTLSAENNWTYTWPDLYANCAGKPIVYTVEEVTLAPGYSSLVTGNAADGFVITNTRIPLTTSVCGFKTWVDANNLYGKRPDSITIHLLKNGAEIAEKTVSAEDNWAWSFTNLPVYENGRINVYTIAEEEVPNYTTVVNGYNVTNFYTLNKTAIVVAKVWDDNWNQDGIRPESVTVKLFANGNDTGRTVTLNAYNGWTAAFDDLDVYVGNKAVTYTVEEVTVTGYEPTYVWNCEGTVVTIFNSHEAAKTSVTVTKEWDDDGNRDGLRPACVKVQLKADGVAVGIPVTLSAENNWQYTWNNLYVNFEGKPIAYTVEEITVAEGYSTQITGSVADGFVITNSRIPVTTSVSGFKTWVDANNVDGKRPESITIKLLADGQQIGSQTVTEKDGWKWTFDNLPKYQNGREIVYTIAEEAVAGYTSKVNGYNVTNYYNPNKTFVIVTKVWDDNWNQDGIRPGEITVRLFADGQPTGRTVTLNAGNRWTALFADLDIFQDGKAIRYTVQEDTVAGYQPTYVWNYVGTVVTIFNRHEVAKTSITATKVWDDGENRDGLRPDCVEVQLKANGAVMDTVTLTADSSWTYTWTGLDVNQAGNPIVYTVEEAEVAEGYTAQVTGSAAEGFTITNSHETETISIPVTKKWNDGGNQDGKRPESIQVVLYADGEATENTLTLTADEDGNWAGTFRNLPKYAAGSVGQEIVYTVVEANVPEGYDSSIGNPGNNYTITNTYAPEQTSVKLMKSWKDEGDQDGIRPASITVVLLANGKETGKTVTLSAENSWTGTFTELPKFENGKEISYSVQEIEAEGYTSEVTQNEDGTFTITNTHDPETTELSVTKAWEDNQNQDGLRPDSVTIQLYANGEKLGEPVELSAENKWSYTFTNLDKNAGGEAIAYTVKEEAVEGYKATYSEKDGVITVTNAHDPETTDLTVSKVWYDNKDKSGLRPDSIQAQLYKNGKAYGDKVELSSENEWKSTFENLPVYEDGEKIEWTVKEVKVPKYYNVSYDQDSLTIMNTIQSDGSAKTGDSFNVWLWVGLMGASVVCIAAFLIVNRKKKKKA